MSAAGVMPSIRAACAKGRGPHPGKLLAQLPRQSRHLAIIEVARQGDSLVPLQSGPLPPAAVPGTAHSKRIAL